MRRFPTKQFEQSGFEQHVMDNAAPITLTLDAAPADQAEGLVVLPKHGDEGFFAGFVYKNLSGNIVKYAITSV